MAPEKCQYKCFGRQQNTSNWYQSAQPNTTDHHAQLKKITHRVWEKVNAKVFAMDGNTAYTYLYTDIHDFSYETKEQNEILHTHTHTHPKNYDI